MEAEKRTDTHVSASRRPLVSVGGPLEIVARFSDGTSHDAVRHARGSAT